MTQTKHGRRKISRMERRVATELGGRKTFASGSGDEKGDGRVPQRFTKTVGGIVPLLKYPLRIENKTTAGNAYALTTDTWFTLKRTALAAGEYPILHIMLLDTAFRLELAVLTLDLATELGLVDQYNGTKLWGRDHAAKTHSISAAKWNVPPVLPMHVHLRPPVNAYTFSARTPRDEHLLVVAYGDLKKALEVHGP
jgi:hypothetical protein